MRDKPAVVSLFSGCGGLDFGFERAGFHTAVMVEVSSFASSTLRRNFSGVRVLGPPSASGDVREVGADDIGIGRVDVLVGGPPCQSFSIAAAQRFLKGDTKFKRIGFRDEVRGSLIHEYLRLLAQLRPEVFVIENVPGLQRLDHGETLNQIIKVCRSLGYNVAAPSVLQAADYGVPQLRQRLIVMGALAEVPEIPPPTHTRHAGLMFAPHATVAEALYALPPDAPNHLPRAHAADSIRRYRRLRFGEREPLGRVDRLDPRKPSKTVIAGGSNGGGRSHLHPFLARTLTVRECARLQTFPDSFTFEGTMSRQFTQVGNAVPPLLAEIIGRSVGRQFFGKKYDQPPSLGIPLDTPSVDECVKSLIEGAHSQLELEYEDAIVEIKSPRSHYSAHKAPVKTNA